MMSINTNTTTGLDALQIARIKRTIRAVESNPNAVPSFNDLGDPLAWWGHTINGITARTDGTFPVYPFVIPPSAIYTDPQTGKQYYRRPPVASWGQGVVQLYTLSFTTDPINGISTSTPQFMPVERLDPENNKVLPQLITVYSWGGKPIPPKYFIQLEWTGIFWKVLNADCAPSA